VIERLGFRCEWLSGNLLQIVCWGRTFRDARGRQLVAGDKVRGDIGVNVRVDGIGGFIEDGCDDARGSVGKLGLLVIEDTVDDTAVMNTLGIRLDGICESGQAFIKLSAEDLTNVGADRDGRLILLVVLEERAAAHLAQRGPLGGLVRVGHGGVT
jgi:hypothetical protein